MTPVPSLWILLKKPKMYYYISWDNTSYFNSKTLTSQGFKKRILSTLTKSSWWEAGLTELYCMELYMDSGSEDLLSSIQLSLDINTQSEDRQEKESCVNDLFMWPVLQVACEISTHSPLTRTHGYALLQKRLGNIKQLVPNRKRKQTSQTTVTLWHRHYCHVPHTQEANSTF